MATVNLGTVEGFEEMHLVIAFPGDDLPVARCGVKITGECSYVYSVYAKAGVTCEKCAAGPGWLD